MLHSIFFWLLTITLVLLPFSRKWVVAFWKFIFRLVKKVLDLILSLLKSLARAVWWLLKNIFSLIWTVFVKLMRFLIWFVPRMLYWVGWMLIEFGRFLLNAIKALIETFKK